MKRSLTLLLASLMLVFALTACGSKTDTAQDGGQNGAQNEATTGQTGGTHDTGAANGGSLLEDAGDAVNDGLDGVENAVDDITGDAARAHRR